MLVEHTELNGELEIKLTFSAYELDILKNEMNGIAGIVEWYSMGPSQMKIESCKKRMHNEWIPKLIDRNIDIPADKIQIMDLIKSQADYMDCESKILLAKQEEEAALNQGI